MKTALTLLASLALFSTVASAHPGCESTRRVVGYTRCGDPIIATYEVVGHTRCGDPVFDWVKHYPREHESRFSVVLPAPVIEFHHGWGDRGHDRFCR